jgi:hypothetical protein
MKKHKHTPILISLVCVLVVLGIGVVVVHAMQPKPKVVPGGSVSIKLNGSVDTQFLNQIQEVPTPQVADPSYGGSSIQQSPQLGVDAWKTLLKDELQ